MSVVRDLQPQILQNSEIGDFYMHYDMKQSGTYIQNLRIRNGYSQGELAKAMNIDQSFLSRIESGQKGCSVDMFIQFSEFFDVTLDALILGIEPDALQEIERKMCLKANIANLIDQLALLSAQL